MPCLRRARAARDDERGSGTTAAHAASSRVSRGRTATPAAGGDEHGRQDGEAGGEVAGRLPDVLDQVEPAAAGHAGVEASGEHEIGEPERDPEHADGAEGPERLTQPVAPGDDDEDGLRGEHERAVRMRRDGGEDRERPERPRPAIASLERAQQRQVRERAREEEEAVHPAVDPVEEERPARRDDDRSDAGPGRVRRAAPRAARRPGCSRRRRTPTAPAGLRGRGRGARPPTRAGSAAARRRAPRARPGTARRAGGGRRRAAASRPRAAARRAAGGRERRPPRP